MEQLTIADAGPPSLWHPLELRAVANVELKAWLRTRRYTGKTCWMPRWLAARHPHWRADEVRAVAAEMAAILARMQRRGAAR